MNKLNHPARPNINWPYAEQLARGTPHRLGGGHVLQRLAGQLNALDEQKHLTVSELKTAVFAIMQSLNRAVPLEEQLREVAALPVGQRSAARGSLAELHLQQPIVENALLKRNQPASARAALPETGEALMSEAVK
jgi:type VI secretion system protein VasL